MELNYANVKVGNELLLDSTKIKREDAFEIIKNNSLDIISEGSALEIENKISFPKNFDIIKILLNRNGVYVAPNIVFNHFKDDKFIGKVNVSTMKSGSVDGILKDIDKFVDRGLNVYIHSYYIMSVDKYIDDDLTIEETWFWYKIGLIKK